MHLIFAHGRSGSSELFRALQAVKGGDSWSWEPFKRRKNMPKLTTIAELEQQLTSVGDHAKHLWTHMGRQLNLELLRPERTEGLVFLYRRNVFDTVISLIVARHTKEWRFVKEGQSLGVVDPKDVLSEMKRLKRNITYYKSVLPKKSGDCNLRRIVRKRRRSESRRQSNTQKTRRCRFRHRFINSRILRLSEEIQGLRLLSTHDWQFR